MLDRVRLPNMLECILPHDHCPFLPVVFFLDAQRQVETPQSYLQILSQLADNHGFEVDKHSLRDPHSRQDRKRIIFTDGFLPPPRNCPVSCLNSKISKSFSTMGI